MESPRIPAALAGNFRRLSRSLDARDDEVHDLPGEGIRQRLVPVQEPVVGGAEQKVEDYLLVGVGRYLAAADGAVQHDLVLGAQLLNDALPPGDPELRIALRLRDEASQ